MHGLKLSVGWFQVSPVGGLHGRLYQAGQQLQGLGVQGKS